MLAFAGQPDVNLVLFPRFFIFVFGVDQMDIFVTEGQAKEIAAKINPIFDEYLAKYEFTKYPAELYAIYKQTYARLDEENSIIHDSLVWKWGHFGKSNFPEKQKQLIRKVESFWPEFVNSEAARKPENSFHWWKSRLPSYITPAYITHLVHHTREVPIIDQHNFRAMNHLLNLIRQSDVPTKARPSQWSDICNLQQFMCAMLRQLPGRDLGELDRFLMMYGRSLKRAKS